MEPVGICTPEGSSTTYYRTMQIFWGAKTINEEYLEPYRVC